MSLILEISLFFQQTDGNLDTRMTMYVNFDPESVFAPQNWQSRVGTVLVARNYRKDLTPQYVEGVWM